MSNVVRAPARAAEAPEQFVKVEAAALGMSLQVDLGAGRICTMQTFVPGDCHRDELNAMLDKMTHAGDRQRAHYKIEELESDLKKVQSAIDQAQYDIDKTNADHDLQMAVLHDEGQTLQKKVDALMSTARDEHVGSGRRGDFHLRGTTLSAYNAGKGAVEKVQEAIVKAENERENTIRNLVNGRKGRLQQLKMIEDEIASCRKIVG
jgi:hypothetical protein